MTSLYRWFPAALFLIGAGLVSGFVAPQQDLELRSPLQSVVPDQIGEFLGEDQELSEVEERVAGVSNYLLRVYSRSRSLGTDWFSLYVGFYGSQMQGRTIHSPKNCLPGSGWEPLRSVVADIYPAEGMHTQVNRYILQRESERVLVLYWYQGRGRVAHSEYGVKFDLLRDAALKRRTDEALVRIVVPVTNTEENAFVRARELAERVIPTLYEALPN